MGPWLVLAYLAVGAILALAWTAFGKRWHEGGAVASFLAAVILWPFFLAEESQSSPVRDIRRARSEFQRLAQKHPDIAYQWMRNDPEAWLVIEPGSKEEAVFEGLHIDFSDVSKSWASFKLRVPKLGGKEITALERQDLEVPFGSSSSASDSQCRFVERYGDRPD